MGCSAYAATEPTSSSAAIAGRYMRLALRASEPKIPFPYCRMQSQESVHTPASAASQVRRIHATERKIRKLEKSSESAHTQGLSQQSCLFSAQTVKLSAASTAKSTMERSIRRVNWYADAAASMPSGMARPMKSK